MLWHFECLCCFPAGANGSGKSTLTHILTGLIGPTHGDAFLFGYSVAGEVAQLRTSIGLCSQVRD